MTGDELSLLQFADRIGLNLFALLTIGFALHFATGVVEREAARRLLLRAFLASAVLLAFAGARLGILVAQLGDGSNPFDPELLPFAWTALGDSTLLISAGALAGLAGLWFGSRLFALVGALLLAAGFGFTGHSQGLTDPGVTPAIVGAHVLIAGFWIAAPLSLFPFNTLDDAQLLARLNRFSAIAIAAIPVLVVLGVWLMLILVGDPQKLLGTTYGLLLLAKLGLGIAAMGVGALNKQVVTAKIAADPVSGRAWLRATLLVEATLFMAAVLAVSAATTIGGPGES